MTELTDEQQARLDLLNGYHRVFAEMLTLDGWEPDTYMGRIVRRSASKIKLWLVDGVTDYAHWEMWVRCQQAIDRALDVITVAHEPLTEKRKRDERVAVLTAP